MSKISTRGRYALRIMIDLARKYAEGPISLRGVASRQNLALKYLEGIVSQLLHSGLLESTRGKDGGYSLTRPAEEYTIYEILRATEGDLSPVGCVTQPDNTCPMKDTCPTQPMWEGLERVIREYLTGVRLSDLLTGPEEPVS